MLQEGNLQCSAPGKLIVCGEWDVLRGGPALSLAVSPRFFCIGDYFSKPAIDLPIGHMVFESQKAQKDESQKSKFLFDVAKRKPVPKDGESFDPFWTPTLCVMERILSVAKPSFVDAASQSLAFKISFKSEWPLWCGLGTSSALTLTLVNFFHAMGAFEFSPDFSFYRNLMRDFQGGRGSGLDLLTQLNGGSVLMENLNLKQTHILKNIPEEITVLHTRKKVSTTQALKRFSADDATLDRLRLINQDFLMACQESDGNPTRQDWLRMIEGNFREFQHFPDIVTPEIRELEGLLKKKNLILGLKTTGAGGGDSLILLSSPGKLRELREFVVSNNLGVVFEGQFFSEGLRVDS